VDLLALNQDGQLIVIELKRHKTPREVVAQGLDYASWAKNLGAEDLASEYRRFSNGGSLGDAFQAKFSQPLDEELLNGSHQIVIVAATLDASTERIVTYLNELGVAINVLFFQVFNAGSEQFLSRTWLIDPVETESKALATSSGQKGEWNGEFYVSFGHGESRHWDEAVRYGFICAGGGSWYTGTLELLSPDDRIWVNVLTELAANLFRVTQTEERIRNKGIKGQSALEATHRAVGREVREIVKKNTGNAPENLPQEKQLPEVRK